MIKLSTINILGYDKTGKTIPTAIENLLSISWKCMEIAHSDHLGNNLRLNATSILLFSNFTAK